MRREWECATVRTYGHQRIICTSQFSPPCGFQGLNLGCWTCWQTPLPPEPPSKPSFKHFRKTNKQRESHDLFQPPFKGSNKYMAAKSDSTEMKHSNLAEHSIDGAGTRPLKQPHDSPFSNGHDHGHLCCGLPVTRRTPLYREATIHTFLGHVLYIFGQGLVCQAR